MTDSKKKLTWTVVKNQLAGLDCKSLLSLIQDLYAFRKDNQVFLHSRFDLDTDVIETHKATILRWINPEIIRKDQEISISKAKKAISDYKKAVGRVEGVAELTVFYCESCTDYLNNYGMDDEGYYDALVRMFEQVLKVIRSVEPDEQADFLERLEVVRRESENWGWGVSYEMDNLMAKYGLFEE